MSYSEMAQLELMNAAANVTSQEDLDALRLTLSLFFAERAQKAIDKMWDETKCGTKEPSIRRNSTNCAVSICAHLINEADATSLDEFNETLKP